MTSPTLKEEIFWQACVTNRHPGNREAPVADHGYDPSKEEENCSG